MSRKQRIFVISRHEVEQMKEDISNRELMSFYWNATGKTVKTFWITTDELCSNYDLKDEGIDDCAFFDNQLFIKYDPGRRILHFDLLPEQEEKSIFLKLQEQMQARKQTPFKTINPPAG